MTERPQRRRLRASVRAAAPCAFEGGEGGRRRRPSANSTLEQVALLSVTCPPLYLLYCLRSSPLSASSPRSLQSGDRHLSLVQNFEMDQRRATLGLPDGATLEQVKQRWRELALETHPDVSAGGAERFRVYNEAYQSIVNSSGGAVYNGAEPARGEAAAARAASSRVYRAFRQVRSLTFCCWRGSVQSNGQRGGGFCAGCGSLGRCCACVVGPDSFPSATRPST